MARDQGKNITPSRVVEMLKSEVEKKSIYRVSAESGLGLATISRYIKGEGEPTNATLEKLSKWSGKSVEWLRVENAQTDVDEVIDAVELAEGLLKICQIIPNDLLEYIEPFVKMCRDDVQGFFEFECNLENIKEEEIDRLRKVNFELNAVLEKIDIEYGE